MLTLSPWARAAAATPATCDALDSWDDGCDATYCAYNSGDQVVWNDTVFECRPWPEGGWCVHRAYEPGTSVGDDAWVEVDTWEGDDDPGADPGTGEAFREGVSASIRALIAFDARDRSVRRLV